jgi:formylglycine-generating enzyme required for sulfatase activity
MDWRMAIFLSLWCCSSSLKCGEFVLPSATTNTLVFIEFKAGDFWMGCPRNPPGPWHCLESAEPEHLVMLSTFAIGKYPITVEQFCEFLNAVSFHDAFTSRNLLFKDISRTQDGKQFMPKPNQGKFAVSGLSFYAAEQYCLWLSKRSGFKCRLPSEAEWEYAAAGGSKRTYPWGEALKHADLWHFPIGTHPELSTPEGVFDLNGPVSQMCLDMYSETFYRISPKVNPVCTSGKYRARRGGPMFRWWGEKLQMVPTWMRFKMDEPREGIGFRIVVEPKDGEFPALQSK